MDYQHITYKREGAVAWIMLNRPEKLNALTGIMLEEWRTLLSTLAQDESCRIVIVGGEGKAWSAGVDLEIFQTVKVEPGFKIWKDGQEIIRYLETMPQVTIAMVNGYCFTGAMEIMMAFDLILAAEEAKIGDTHTKWGIPPKWGMTQRLSRQVGLRKAKELSFTAQAISGKEAEKIGLINKAHPLADLRAEVLALVEKILENSGQTIAAVKELYQFGHTHSLPEGLAYEESYQIELTDKADHLKNFKKNI